MRSLGGQLSYRRQRSQGGGGIDTSSRKDLESSTASAYLSVSEPFAVTLLRSCVGASRAPLLLVVANQLVNTQNNKQQQNNTVLRWHCNYYNTITISFGGIATNTNTYASDCLNGKLLPSVDQRCPTAKL